MAEKKKDDDTPENVVTDGPHLAGPVYPSGQERPKELDSAPKAAPVIPVPPVS